MTRFARAKGSKSSNEKKPEEATSWLEMKKGMLSKPKGTPEEKKIEKNNAVVPNKTEWASLGDDSNDRYLSQNNKNLKKFNEKSKTSKVISKKNKNQVKDHLKTENNDKDSPAVTKKKKNSDTTSLGQLEACTSNIKSKKRKIDEVNDDLAKVIKKKKQKKGEKNKNVNISINNCEDKVVKKKLKKETLVLSKNESVSSVQNPSKGLNKKGFEKQNSATKKKNKDKPFKYDNTVIEELIVNGKTISVVKFQGFNVMKEDAERLKDLRNEMLKQGIPKEKLEVALKLERRRAEKALSRLKKSVCFHCRGMGHLLSDCPNLQERENTGTGICYKCGSTEHLSVECKVVKGTNFAYAECFICKEQGHIARQCPDNPRGLYPQGGACRECGDVTHLRKDCPQVASKKSEEIFTVRRRTDGYVECLDEEIVSKEKSKVKPVKKKSVKF